MQQIGNNNKCSFCLPYYCQIIKDDKKMDENKNKKFITRYH